LPPAFIARAGRRIGDRPGHEGLVQPLEKGGLHWNLPSAIPPSISIVLPVQ
jgi:hypothetical protein